MKNVKYFNKHDTPLSLTNLYFRNNSSVIEIEDVVENATTATELRDGLNALKLNEKFEIDRVTDSYVRLKSTDGFGNVHYLKANFEKKPSRNLKYYYEMMTDNYIIPVEEMTDDLMKEALALLKEKPFQNKENTYLMFLYNDGDGDNWCITSWIE